MCNSHPPHHGVPNVPNVPNAPNAPNDPNAPGSRGAPLWEAVQCRGQGTQGEKATQERSFQACRADAPIPDENRRLLARRCLDDGGTAGKRQLTALAQAKLAYVSDILGICSRFHCRVFSSIVSKNAPRSMVSSYLRRDYACLFERFFYFLEDMDPSASGIIVFDALEKTRSHIPVEQMDRDFKNPFRTSQRAFLCLPRSSGRWYGAPSASLRQDTSLGSRIQTLPLHYVSY